MQTSFQSQSYPRAVEQLPLAPQVEVLILYEDYGTGLRARRSLDRLPEHLPTGARLSTKLWRIQLLDDSLLHEQAAVEAAGADVIILSVHGRSALPPTVQAWLNRWLCLRQRRACALGVLLDPEEASRGSANRVAAFMQQVAAIGGVDLLYGFSEPLESELDSAVEAIHERAHQSSAVLEDMLSRTEPHQWWGINE